ncbi:hypothetical protein VOLCADRAFT_86963 [Volvox carteri f. nagariensis]|uniref:Non-structural maintenance of chromosomes element 1 homolog n=1 Tax=Volvox carteri f. nagariensis TaxID=3068 RepID=D8TKU5_VOLCA|nr:uncharacterized protein VOLCADRAFT_86963 [Volvox carteri f. nagariensis]EFJ52127.1 hypothetical protein VOLCADRAFT_86963 [Volvox carteri f. nagariensis]|eukprot:XP_002946901.1 hypothetical protein VOLCADRAFT_86963 [Volvox carteri f. nagariensis]
MPPRRAPGGSQPATQAQHGNDGAGPSGSASTFPDYVTFTVGQAIISGGCLEEVEVKAMVRRLAQRNSDDAYMPVLSKLQRDTEFLGLSIERIKFPWNNTWYVCLVGKEKDDASKQLGSKYTADQVQYYRSVVEALCEAEPAENRLLASVSQIRLKNVDVQRQSGATQGASQSAAKARKLSQLDKESVLKAFAHDGWLYEPERGYYTLGPRALGELKDWLLSLLPHEVVEKLQADYM